MNVVAVAAEQLGANFGILPGFHATQFRLGWIKHNSVNPKAAKQRYRLFARFGDQVAGEKSPVANNDAHGELLRNTGHCVLSSKMFLLFFSMLFL